MRGPMWMPRQPPTLDRLLAFHPQPIPLIPVLVSVALITYVVAGVMLSRRGVRWPLPRTLSWVAGSLLTLAVTATGIEGYGMTLMSVHMAEHMVLAMMAPILLLLGDPLTLALRVLPVRGPRSRPRRLLVKLLSSTALRFLTSAPVRWLIFLSGLYGMYFTPVFDHLMTTVWGHNLMLVHFLATGLLFFGPVLQAGPWPARRPAGLRLIEAFASTPFHAFFGIALMMAAHPVVDYFKSPPPGWQVDILADENIAGGIAWASSELPTFIVIAVLFVQWVHTEHRLEARAARFPGRADDELAAYNQMLASLERRKTP